MDLVAKILTQAMCRDLRKTLMQPKPDVVAWCAEFKRALMGLAASSGWSGNVTYVREYGMEIALEHFALNKGREDPQAAAQAEFKSWSSPSYEVRR